MKTQFFLSVMVHQVVNSY